MAPNADVIIVGAGFTGLSAATALVDKGLSCILLEARGRVGGRVEAESNTLGELVDTGGQFLCEDMPSVMALARQRRRHLVETPMRGRFVTQPALPKGEAEDVYRASFALRERMAGIAETEAGSLSVAQWLAEQPEPEQVKNAFRSMFEGLWCQPLEVVPLAYLADNDRRATNETTELQYFPAATMHGLALDLARDLGERVLLSMPVERIARREDGVAVSSGGRIFEARAAVVAVPPVAASAIAFDPALPAPLAAALSAWRSGSVIKVLLRFAEPFWRRKGLSGMVMWRDVHGLFACDASRDDDHAMLAVFIGGPLALEWRAKRGEVMRADLVERLAAALGPEAREVIAYTVRDWCGDRWSGGGYSDAVIDMAPDAEARLSAGWPPLYFSCSELSPSFPGYVEGALVAGRMVAERSAGDLYSPIATRASGS